MEKLLGHPKTGSIDPPKNLATPSKKGRKVAFSVMSDTINIGLSIYPQTQAKKAQSVNIVRKESSRMKTNWKKASYRFSTIVLLGQLFDNDNKKPVLVKIKGYELIKSAAK